MGVVDGKVAVVTGGARGIGQAEAMQLAAEGAKVVVNDLGGALVGGGTDTVPAQEVAAEIRARGGDAVANDADVGSWDGAKGLIGQAVDTFGTLDILVNNAGVIRTGMSFNSTEDDWDLVIRVHQKGTFLTSRFAGEYWRNQAKAGSPVDAVIVNTSSPNGLNGGNPGHVNYAAAKSAIATMTITFARELAPYGVRVNAIAPVAMTRMTHEAVDSGFFTETDQTEMSPQGVAAIVAWLASPLATGVSGQVLAVAGRTCTLWESWHPVSAVQAPGPWTIDALDAVHDTLFSGRDRGVPPMGGPAADPTGR